MSQTFSFDNIHLNGGTLLGAPGTTLFGGLYFQDKNRIYFLNDANGLSGYNIDNDTLYGPQESGAGNWLEYDDEKITSIDCLPIEYLSFLVVACNGGKIASYDSSNDSWVYPDGTGSGNGPHNNGAATNNEKITKMTTFATSILVVGTEKGKIASYHNSAWTGFDSSIPSEPCSNGDMLGRNAVAELQAPSSTKLQVYERSGRVFNWVYQGGQPSAWVSDMIKVGVEIGSARISCCLGANGVLVMGTDNGAVLTFNGAETALLEDSIFGGEKVTACCMISNTFLFGSVTGKISSYDGSNWHFHDDTGSGAQTYNSGAAVNHNKLVSIISILDRVYLVAKDKMLATGNFSDELWYEYDGSTAVLEYTSAGTIPNGMVGLFSSIPSGSSAEHWLLCDGTNFTPDLDGLYPMGYNQIGSPTGSHHHTHEPWSGNTSNCTGLGTVGRTGIYTNEAIMYSHVHPAGHTHGNQNHEPLYYTMIPAMSSWACTSIPANTMFFFAGATAPTGWSFWTTPEGKFIKFSTSIAGSTGGSASHTHAHAGSEDIGYGSYTGGYDFINHPPALYAIHHHSIPGHSHANNPYHGDLRAIRNTSDATVCPSGLIAFFILRDAELLSPGWSVITELTGALIKCGSTVDLVPDGDEQHNHPSAQLTCGQSSASSPGNNSAADQGRFASTTHRHTLTHGHTTYGSSMPAHIRLLIARKD